MTKSFFEENIAKYQTVENRDDLFLNLHTLNDLDAFVEHALDSILDIADAHAGSLFLWDEYRKELVLKAARGPYLNSAREVAIKLRQGILGTVGDEGQSILVRNIHEDDRFQSHVRTGDYRSGSFISIPLIEHNKLMGVVNITERESRIPFEETDLLRAQQFARHIAVAFDNLRLIHHLKRDAHALNGEITSLKQRLRDNETFVAIGKLAANLTHELNNPLDAIRRYVNMAIDQCPEDSLAREYLLKGKKGIRRAVRVVRGLLQFSRESHRKAIRTVEIHDLIDEGLEAVSHDISFSKIKIEKQYEATPTVIQDRGLEVVLKNLCRNAHHAMNGEGTLKVITLRNNGMVDLIVQDSGLGVPEEIRSRIFEPFVSLKEEGLGTGMGLTICREIVERCGGKIYCENAVPQGARFVIRLPYIYVNEDKSK